MGLKGGGGGEEEAERERERSSVDYSSQVFNNKIKLRKEIR